MSSALSAASSACDHVRDWVKGTPADTWVSMGVFSDGSYNAPKVPQGPCLMLCKDVTGLARANKHNSVFTCISCKAKLLVLLIL